MKNDDDNDERYFDGLNDGILIAMQLITQPLKKVRKGWYTKFWNINPVKRNLKELESLMKKGHPDEK